MLYQEATSLSHNLAPTGEAPDSGSANWPLPGVAGDQQTVEYALPSNRPLSRWVWRT